MRLPEGGQKVRPDRDDGVRVEHSVARVVVFLSSRGANKPPEERRGARKGGGWVGEKGVGANNKHAPWALRNSSSTSIIVNNARYTVSARATRHSESGWQDRWYLLLRAQSVWQTEPADKENKESGTRKRRITEPSP